MTDQHDNRQDFSSLQPGFHLSRLRCSIFVRSCSVAPRIRQAMSCPLADVVDFLRIAIDRTDNGRYRAGKEETERQAALDEKNAEQARKRRNRRSAEVTTFWRRNEAMKLGIGTKAQILEVGR